MPRTGFPRARAYRYLPAAALLLVYLTLAATYSVVTPLWKAPDEVGHFRYVAHLLNTRTLPLQRTGELGENHQPPLYYLIAAIAALPAEQPPGRYQLLIGMYEWPSLQRLLVTLDGARQGDAVTLGQILVER